MASGATCVQRLDGSRDSAIHTKYRISLRSSSMREPRYPLPRVVLFIYSNRSRSNRRGRVTVSGAPTAGIVSLSFLDAFRARVRLVPGARGGPTRTRRGGSGACSRPLAPLECCNVFAGPSAGQVSTMILPQVHLRKPCYDFSFL